MFQPSLMLFAQFRKAAHPPVDRLVWTWCCPWRLAPHRPPSFCSPPFILSIFSSLSPCQPPPFPPFQCPGPADHVPADDSQADVWALSGLRGGFPHQLEWRKGCSYTGSLAEEIRWGKGQSTQKRERERSRKEGKEREKGKEIYPKSSTTTL